MSAKVIALPSRICFDVATSLGVDPITATHLGWRIWTRYRVFETATGLWRDLARCEVSLRDLAPKRRRGRR